MLMTIYQASIEKSWKNLNKNRKGKKMEGNE
jgi:hypothetical protein